MEGELKEGGWWITAENVLVKFTGCPFSTSCTYEETLKLKVQMDAEGAFVDPENAAFKLVEGSGLCAATGKWTTGRTRVDWKLDDIEGSVHKKIWPSLLESHPWIALCDAQQLSNCETNDVLKHPLKGNARLLVGKGKFDTGFVTVECTSGEGETNQIESQQEQKLATTKVVPEKSFAATLETLTFAGCTKCKEVAVTVPRGVKLWMESELETSIWWITAAAAKVKFTSCPEGVTCTYSGSLQFKVQMNAEGAFFDPEGKEFTLSEGGGLCAATGKWESGRTRVDWKLDDAKGSVHKKVWPTLLENLTAHEGVEL